MSRPENADRPTYSAVVATVVASDGVHREPDAARWVAETLLARLVAHCDDAGVAPVTVARDRQPARAMAAALGRPEPTPAFPGADDPPVDAWWYVAALALDQ